jgi:hypothetical protein
MMSTMCLKNVKVINRNKYIEKNLCITEFIYQEFVHRFYVQQLSSETKWSPRKCFVDIHVIILRNFTPSLDCSFLV